MPVSPSFVLGHITALLGRSPLHNTLLTHTKVSRKRTESKKLYDADEHAGVGKHAGVGV